MVKKTFNPKSLLQSSFQPTLLDAPLRRRRRIKNKQIYFEPLPKPSQSTPYVPPKPVPPPRRKKPVALPRSGEARVPDPRVQKLVEEIAPFYTPKAIQKFRDKVRRKVQIIERKKALKNNVKSFEVEGFSSKDPRMLFASTQNDITQKLAELLEKKGPFKFSVTLQVNLKKRMTENGQDLLTFREPYFNSSTFTIMNSDEIEEALERAAEEILNKIALWISEGSGWVIENIISHFLNIVSYVPLRGSSYLPLPEELRNSRKGLINIKNNDNECLRWCHIRHLNPLKNHNERITARDKELVKTLDYSGVTFPVSIKDMDRIEKQNIFGYSDGNPYPIRISSEKYDDHLELLLIVEGGEDTITLSKEKKTQPYRQHYVYIKDFNQFMYNFSKMKTKKYFCMHCQQCFYSAEHLENHNEECLLLNGTQRIEMPQPGSKVYFHNHQKQLPGPLVIYADLEAITKKIDTCSPPGGKSYTQAYQKHEASGFGYKVVCHYNQKYSKPAVIYRDENVIEKFFQHLFEEVKDCQKVISERAKKRLVMTVSDEKDFQNAEKCWICDRKYKPDEGENIPVRDHCHMTGKYRGSAHRKCNLKLQISAEKIKIPVVFHNLKGYDSHFIIEKLGDIIKEEPLDINVIATNAEKYMAIYLGKHLAFIDSFQFMSQSLAKLSSNLPDDKYIYTSESFQGERLALMKEKGVYPYDYMDAVEKFAEKQLPDRRDFYSFLTDEDISEKEYRHAQKVWDTFRIENMGQYHDLYLKSDVLLLADVFQNFRETCLAYYGLDPCHYVSSPGLSWDAMLKMTKINLDLISDIEMQLFIEKGMRGGISYIAHRHTQANNKYMKNYNEAEESSYIMYLDANNLYGWAMSQNLPSGNFHWIPCPEYINLDSYDENSAKGLIFRS